jgi:hypothetical protein
MPIPLIIWGIGLAVAAFYHEEIADEISKFMKSDTGKKLATDINNVAKAEMAPLQKIIENSYDKESSERRQAFAKFKRDNTEYRWKLLVNLCMKMATDDTKYSMVFADISHVAINS